MFERSDSKAIIYKDKIYTYKDLEDFTQLLIQHTDSNELIVHLTNSSFESIGAYIGFLKNKRPQLLLQENINEEFLKNILKNYKPRYIYLPKGYKFTYKKVAEFEEYCLLKTDYKKDYQINKNLALLLSTSGSIGIPKCVIQSFKNIYSNALAIKEYLQIKSDDAAITTLPTNYTFMLSIIHSHIISGASIVAVKESIMQKEFWESLKKHKVTSISGVPFTFEMLKKLRFERMKLDSLRYITQAGGKLSNELIKYFYSICKEKGVKFIVMYGQTEATARISYLPYKYLPQKIGSIGIPIPGGKMWIEDDEGKKITKPNTEGELIYSGDNVTLGYASSCYDLAKEDEFKGILKTGDLAMFDEDGFFYITGRKKRFVKIYGNRISLDELEKILKKNEYECIVSGNDEKIKLYCLDDKKDEIITLLSKSIKQNKKIFEFKKVDKILRNSAGKVLYKEMENIYG